MPELSEYSRKWRPVSHAWPIVAAACLGLAVAVSAWFAVSIWEERLARAKFTAIAGDYASILQNGLDDYLGKILETEAQVRFLMGAGCEYAQGYYCSRPVTALKVTELLRAGRVEPATGHRLTSSAA
jgi:hypothetical protein